MTLSPTTESILDTMLANAQESSTIPADAPAPPLPSYTPLRLPLAYNTHSETTKAAYTATQLWLNDIIHRARERARWLVIYGNPGTGKTHLLNNATRILREFRLKVLQKRAADMATSLREGNTHLLENIWAPANILTIDDFGAEYHTDYITSQWFDLLDQRIGKWTIITTNLTPNQIAKRYDHRIASRITDGRNTLVDLTAAADYRLTLNTPTA